ncbi:MAG: hypothetical protein ACRETM_03625 [Stenotrophobium sp.]
MANCKQAIVVLGALALTGCAGFSGLSRIFGGGQPVDVNPAGYSENCGSQRPETTIRTLANADELQKWQASRGMTLLNGDASKDGPYALIELGQRAGSGYGLVVSRNADIEDNVLTLHATFFAPDHANPDASATSPCALISLPPGLYQAVRVENQSGKVMATSQPGA